MLTNIFLSYFLMTFLVVSLFSPTHLLAIAFYKYSQLVFLSKKGLLLRNQNQLLIGA